MRSHVYHLQRHRLCDLRSKIESFYLKFLIHHYLFKKFEITFLRLFSSIYQDVLTQNFFQYLHKSNVILYQESRSTDRLSTSFRRSILVRTDRFVACRELSGNGEILTKLLPYKPVRTVFCLYSYNIFAEDKSLDFVFSNLSLSKLVSTVTLPGTDVRLLGKSQPDFN